MRIMRRVTRVCDDRDPGAYRTLSDTFIISGARCDGSGHDGCQAGCALLWRGAWLEPEKKLLHSRSSLPEGAPAAAITKGGATCSDQRVLDRYICQLTALGEASSPFGSFDPKSYFADLRSKNCSACELGRSLSIVLLNHAARIAWKGNFPSSPKGTNRETPNIDLRLNIGDRVKVKPLREIRATLDKTGCNRGLHFEYGMLKYLEKEFMVEGRVERLISPKTGRMILTRPETPLIRLSGTICDGVAYNLCQRLEHFLWREIWLEKM